MKGEVCKVKGERYLKWGGGGGEVYKVEGGREVCKVGEVCKVVEYLN